MAKKYPAKPIKNPKTAAEPVKNSVKPERFISSVVSILEKKDWLWITAIAILSFFLYANTLKFGNTFDDDIYTHKNKYAQEGIGALGSIWKYGTIQGFTVAPNNSGIYRPFTLTTFALEKSIFGDLEPKHSHFINVLLYALTVLFLGAFLVKICKNIDIPIYVPLLITLLYACHPLHTEVVASVKSRDEILAMLLPFMGLNFFWNYLRENKPYWLIIGLLSFLFGLFSKENPLMLMGIIPVILYIFAQKNIKESILLSLPFFVIGVFYLLIRTSILDKYNSSGVDLVVNNIIWGAKGSEIYSTNLSVWLEYIRLLFVPHPLSYDYSFNQIPVYSWNNFNVWLSLVLYLGAGIGGLWLSWKKQPIGLGLLLYLFTFFVYSNLIPKYVIASTLAERFMFMPSLGFCMFVVLAVYTLLKKLKPQYVQYGTIGLFTVISIVYSVLTINRNPVWKDNVALFESGIKSSPNSFRTHYNMGETLRVRGEADLKAATTKNDKQGIEKAKKLILEAASHYENSLKIYDNAPFTLYNLGVCYTAVNDTANAEKAYQKSHELNPKGMAANNLGVISFWKKDYPKSVFYFEQALQSNNPERGNILSNLGAAYHNQGKYAEAINYYEQSLAVAPTPNLVQNLINLYTATNNPEKADYYKKMIGNLKKNP